MRAYEVDYNNGIVTIDGTPNDVLDDKTQKKKLYAPVTIGKVPQNAEYSSNGMTNDVKDRVDNHKRTWVINGTSRNYLIDKKGNDESKWLGDVSLITKTEEIKEKDGNPKKIVKTIYAKGSKEDWSHYLFFLKRFVKKKQLGF